MLSDRIVVQSPQSQGIINCHIGQLGISFDLPLLRESLSASDPEQEERMRAQ
jgi:hypothetical protein